MDVAIATVMRDALLRRSEAAALTWADVERQPDGTGRAHGAPQQGRPGGRGRRALYRPRRDDGAGARPSGVGGPHRAGVRRTRRTRHRGPSPAGRPGPRVSRTTSQSTPRASAWRVTLGASGAGTTALTLALRAHAGPLRPQRAGGPGPNRALLRPRLRPQPRGSRRCGPGVRGHAANWKPSWRMRLALPGQRPPDTVADWLGGLTVNSLTRRSTDSQYADRLTAWHKNSPSSTSSAAPAD